MKTALLFLPLILTLGSCVPKARTNQLAPVIRSSTQTGQAVMVTTSGGSDQAKIEGIGVTSADAKQALESSLVDSGLFTRIGEGGYQLNAKLVAIEYPGTAFSVTTRIEVLYTLQRAGSVVWKDSIRSSHRTETGEAMLGEFRERMSTEGALRENIRIAISTMAQRLQ